MHCMGHWYSIRGVKACSSFRWIKQFTCPLQKSEFDSIGGPRGGFSTAKSEITLSNGQIQVRKQHTCIVWITDTPSIVWKRAHHSLGSSNRLTCPLRNLEHVEFSTEKSEITLSNGQIQAYKQRTCIAWVTSTPFVASKRAQHSVGSSNSPTCPLQN